MTLLLSASSVRCAKRRTLCNRAQQESSAESAQQCSMFLGLPRVLRIHRQRSVKKRTSTCSRPSRHPWMTMARRNQGSDACDLDWANEMLEVVVVVIFYAPVFGAFGTTEQMTSGGSSSHLTAQRGAMSRVIVALLAFCCAGRSRLQSVLHEPSDFCKAYVVDY
mmetsp:Transcript_68930/g.165433  ORF Transcript_68930/g.165433 Transcript_68930/m.165433 type:complete len:164 (-) Transcript_68930:8-499(-)